MIDVVYMDFRKAFDTVPHMRLFKKIEAYGIQGRVLQWIRNFLQGRRQRVVIGDGKSSWADILSGIPQGSVLGPILFVIFINDLPDVVACTAKIFADDTKIYQAIKKPEDAARLQQDLNRLAEWSDRWQLHFNMTKCKTLHMGSHNPRNVYDLNGEPLDSTPEEKDLGVIIDEGLKFHQHVAKAVSKASRMLGLVKHTFTCLDRTTVPLLFSTMVRPHLEYGNLIWSPRYRRDRLEIEKVQRRATKLICDIRNLPYQERLQALHLPSLEYRRRRGDMIAVFKVGHWSSTHRPRGTV